MTTMRSAPIRAAASTRTEADRAVAHDDDRVALLHPAATAACQPVPMTSDRREQRRHQGLVGHLAGRHERAVRQRHADVLALPAVDEPPVPVLAAPEATRRAPRLDPDPAVRTGVVGVHERRDDEVPGPDAAHLRADLLDDADELVPDARRLAHLVDAAVGPQVAAADARRRDAHEGVRRGLQRGVGHLVEPDVAGGVQDGRLHAPSLPRGIPCGSCASASRSCPSCPGPRPRRGGARPRSSASTHAWTYDHLVWAGLPDSPWYGALPTLTAAATVTSRIRLGTFVSSPNYRHPYLFLRDLLALDDVSGGRVLCGLGHRRRPRRGDPRGAAAPCGSASTGSTSSSRCSTG